MATTRLGSLRPTEQLVEVEENVPVPGWGHVA